MENGKIKKIKIFFEKGVPPQSPAKAECAADLGLVGDRYAKGGEKQLTAIDTQCVEWMEKQEVKGLCFARFKANLDLENMDLSLFKPGDKLICGNVIFEVSPSEKECFEQCARVQQDMDCCLRKHAKYLMVRQGGTISVNDKISKML